MRCREGSQALLHSCPDPYLPPLHPPSKRLELRFGVAGASSASCTPLHGFQYQQPTDGSKQQPTGLVSSLSLVHSSQP